MRGITVVIEVERRKINYGPFFSWKAESDLESKRRESLTHLSLSFLAFHLFISIALYTQALPWGILLRLKTFEVKRKQKSSMLSFFIKCLQSVT